MRNGIVAGALAPSLRYVDPITQACTTANWFPSVAYAIFWRETISGEVAGLWPSAADVISSDGGHGLGQLTESYPPDWADPYANALYAIDHFLKGAEVYWAFDVQGEDLVRCIAAEYNAGRARTIEAHDKGNVDLATTDGYAAAVLGFYRSILATGKPT